ncbi:TorF family putative porin [Bdellovibrio sp. HCB337]|uniref:TorF family putative porin n=1 Tax=Bdellovibrio sp. HCB337 TaxID=3394358 RepID=UPI0039A5141D
MIKNAAHKFILKTALLACSVVFSLQSRAQSTDDSKGEVPTFKMTGEVALLTNYVEHGLTQTNKDPSLQGAFGFNFGPQFKLGLSGSNVSFADTETEHFLLKLNAELKVLISTTTDFKLGYFNNRYFKTEFRDGSTTYLVITSHGYRVRYESNSNWEGTGASSSYYSFGKAFDLSPTWKWDNEIGYTMLDVEGYENYFDARTSFQYKGSSNVVYQITATGTSTPSQFNGQGEIFFLVGAATTF